MNNFDTRLEEVLKAFEINESDREKCRTHTWYDFKRYIICSKCCIRLSSLLLTDEIVKWHELTCEEIIIKKLLE